MSTLNDLSSYRPALPSRIGGLIAGPPKWPTDLVSPQIKKSAVAMIFFVSSVNEPAQLLFIKRSANLSSHRGQVGLPGGHAEAEDGTPFECAARETFEEIGLPKEQLIFWGQLPELQALNGTPVVPIVAVTTASPRQLTKAESEVESIFLVPWTECKIDRVEDFRFNMFGVWRRSSRVQTSGGSIWGLTAKILESADLQP